MSGDGRQTMLSVMNQHGQLNYFWPSSLASFVVKLAIWLSLLQAGRRDAYKARRGIDLASASLKPLSISKLS
jgi:hypothetical protein